LLTEALSHLDTSAVAMGNIAGMVADAYARAGHLATALRYVDEALRVSAKTGEIWMDAELHRLKGVVLSALPVADEKSAEMHFLRAVDIAESQGAKLWGLRAATSLARLWARRGRREDAVNLLAPLCGWFADDDSAADLAEAELLLRQLTGTATPDSRRAIIR
jgi:predicted ATPase